MVIAVFRSSFGRICILFTDITLDWILDETEGKIFTFLQVCWYRYLVNAKLYDCEKLGVKVEKQGALEATSSERKVTANKQILLVCIVYHFTEMVVAT